MTCCLTLYNEGLEQQRAICILVVLRKLALKICCCTVHIQIVRQYFWWYSTVEHLYQWALLLVGSWCSKDHFDTKTSFWPKMQIALCCSDPSIIVIDSPLNDDYLSHSRVSISIEAEVCEVYCFAIML